MEQVEDGLHNIGHVDDIQVSKEGIAWTFSNNRVTVFNVENNSIIVTRKIDNPPSLNCTMISVIDTPDIEAIMICSNLTTWKATILYGSENRLGVSIPIRNLSDA